MERGLSELMDRTLGKGLECLGLSKQETLLQYLRELQLWNPRLGLVEAEGEDLVIRHVLDSLAPLEHIRAFKPQTVADLGTGAGLPGIPLAVYMPDSRFSLVERSGRRVGFLKNVVALLRLENVKVYQADYLQHELPVEQEGTHGYDMVIFRAFRPFSNELLTGVRRLLSPGGVLVAYKGREAKAQDDIKMLSTQGVHGELISLTVPFLEHERSLVLAHFP